MIKFIVGELYTRDQIRAAIGLPSMSGGDWATGYARLGNEVFVFCNIGVAGRTGHDYPNRWIENTLDWFGKTSSTLDQPLITAMLSGELTTHIFWRGRDRAPFIYAGIGVAEGAWGEKPVEVLWHFPRSPQSTLGQSEPLPQRSVSRGVRTAFLHGPPPSFGFKQMLAEDGECRLYLMALEGAVDALFPILRPATTNRSIIKVGISKDPQRRERELNVGFPRGAAASWQVRNTRTFGAVREAYNAEGFILERLAASGCWLSGEFGIVADADLDGLLG